jgi:glycosyltransferase involved in cell wall biosynthesis
MGAPQARLSELAARFVKRGHEVVVLTAMPSYPRGRIYPGYGGIYRWECEQGVSILRTCIYPTKSAELLPRLANYFSFVGASLLLGSIRLPKADYLLVESPPLFLGISGYLLSRLKSARWIFNVSDLWPQSAVDMGVVQDGFGLRVAQILEAFCYRKAWLVTGQSKEIQSDVQRRFPSIPTYHLSNGVDTTVFCPDQGSLELRRELGDPQGCIAIYAGLHGLAQGLEQILQAASLLQDLTNLQIAFVGDGPEKELLIEQAKTFGLTNVRFLDPYPRDAMPALMASADIALVPLKLHLPGAVPSKLYEAMGAGLPLVLAAEGEAAAIVRETQAGMVVPPGDGYALAAALRELVQNKDKRAQLGANGRQAAIARFDRQRIADAFMDMLEEKLPC